MHYELYFWCLVAFLAGRWLPRTIYIGTDPHKYDAADIGILFTRGDKS